MIEFNQLNTAEQEKIKSLAMDYFREFKWNILKTVGADTAKIAPTGSDLFHPALWKSIHWKWFLDNSFLL